jgi:hypothetical protein
MRVVRREDGEKILSSRNLDLVVGYEVSDGNSGFTEAHKDPQCSDLYTK